jgi:uncharacterized protein (DUF3820 family)
LRHGTRLDELEREIEQRRDEFLARLPPITPEAAATIHVSFGKHRGRLVKDLPTSYLEWMSREFNPWPAEQPELAAAVLELKRRESQTGALA